MSRDKVFVWDKSIRDCQNQFPSTMEDSNFQDNICDVCLRDMDDIRYCVIIEGDEKNIIWCCLTCFMTISSLFDKMNIEYTAYWLN